MIKSVENLEAGDIFKVGNTPVTVTEVIEVVGRRNTHREFALTTLYSDGGQTLHLTFVLPKEFLIELVEA